MRKASEMVDQVVYKLDEFIKPGMMERDIIKKIPEFLKRPDVMRCLSAP